MLEDRPERWLPDAEELEPGWWRTSVRGAGITRPVVARIGEPWRSHTTSWRAISWEPGRESEPGERARLLPAFDGELGLFIAGSDASLALEGSYRPPGGPLGAALDDLALHRVARSTAERLLAGIAARLVDEAGPPTQDPAAGRFSPEGHQAN